MTALPSCHRWRVCLHSTSRSWVPHPTGGDPGESLSLLVSGGCICVAISLLCALDTEEQICRVSEMHRRVETRSREFPFPGSATGLAMLLHWGVTKHAILGFTLSTGAQLGGLMGKSEQWLKEGQSCGTGRRKWLLWLLTTGWYSLKVLAHSVYTPGAHSPSRCAVLPYDFSQQYRGYRD